MKIKHLNQKSFYLFYLISSLFIVLLIQILYIYQTKSVNDKIVMKKLAFVNITQLPDLAISTEATYIRHRSLSSIFNIFKDDGNLREYFPSTFTYNHSTLINNTPNRIVNEK